MQLDDAGFARLVVGRPAGDHPGPRLGGEQRIRPPVVGDIPDVGGHRRIDASVAEDPLDVPIDPDVDPPEFEIVEQPGQDPDNAGVAETQQQTSSGRGLRPSLPDDVAHHVAVPGDLCRPSRAPRRPDESDDEDGAHHPAGRAPPASALALALARARPGRGALANAEDGSGEHGQDEQDDRHSPVDEVVVAESP